MQECRRARAPDAEAEGEGPELPGRVGKPPPSHGGSCTRGPIPKGRAQVEGGMGSGKSGSPPSMSSLMQTEVLVPGALWPQFSFLF